MPELTHFDVVVEVRTTVRESATGRRLLDVTTSGKSTGDTAAGLVAGAAPALTNALAHHAPLIESYRRGDTDAALAKRHTSHQHVWQSGRCITPGCPDA